MFLLFLVFFFVHIIDVEKRHDYIHNNIKYSNIAIIVLTCHRRQSDRWRRGTETIKNVFVKLPYQKLRTSVYKDGRDDNDGYRVLINNNTNKQCSLLSFINSTNILTKNA